jgi:hypothetical protein
MSELGLQVPAVEDLIRTVAIDHQVCSSSRAPALNAGQQVPQGAVQLQQQQGGQAQEVTGEGDHLGQQQPAKQEQHAREQHAVEKEGQQLQGGQHFESDIGRTS